MNISGENSKAYLKGAQFSLLDGEKNQIEFIRTNEGYQVASEKDKAENPDKLVKLVESDSKGFIRITDLKMGTYYLIEEKAPDGFDLLKDPITVEVAPNSTGTSVLRLEKEIKNEPKKIVLPNTGGAALDWFTNSGLLLMGTSGIGMAWKYRSRKGKKQKNPLQ